MSDHASRIRDQFTRQAIPFATAPAISDAAMLEAMAEFGQVGGDDAVLDVACGPGLIASAFARRARSVTGIDLTPAMIERANVHCAAQGLSNVRFDTGDVMRLPYADGAFTLVVSRFAFHHFEQPEAVLREMVRVCSPNGRILLIDAVCSDDPVKGEAFNRVEKIRDPSHVVFRPLATLQGWIAAAGLVPLGVCPCPVKSELEAVLARSFPESGGADRIRAAFAAAVEHDSFGVGLHRVGQELHYAYPAVALLARRP
jgi:SAM-dependent methyltransferase